MDPRLSVIGERLKGVKSIIPVSGGKGGVGKSSVASALALILSEMGHGVGLLDLDFCGPSDHVMLGAGDVFPEEEKGIVPPEVHGIRFMSIVYYARDEPVPMRGVDVSNAIIELLTITRWGELDFLIVDMPPGIGDTTLDVIRLMRRAEFLIVSTESIMAMETVKKMSVMLRDLKIPVMGVIENMKKTDSSSVRDKLGALGVEFLGDIGFDENLEKAMGNPGRLLKTGFFGDLRGIVSDKLSLTPDRRD